MAQSRIQHSHWLPKYNPESFLQHQSTQYTFYYLKMLCSSWEQPKKKGEAIWFIIQEEGKQGKFKLKYTLGQEVIQFIYFLYCLCRETPAMNWSLVHSGASQGTKCSQILPRALGASTGEEQGGNGVCPCGTLPPSLESQPLITAHELSKGSFPSRCAKNPQHLIQWGLWTGETPGRLGKNSSSLRIPVPAGIIQAALPKGKGMAAQWQHHQWLLQPPCLWHAKFTIKSHYRKEKTPLARCWMR